MKQFNLRQLLVEVALLGTFLGLARWVYGDLPSVIRLILLPATMAGIAGAFIGGLTRRYWFGALIGTVSWLAVEVTETTIWGWLMFR